MKYSKIYVLGLLMMLFGCSEDFLERESLTDLGSDSFWTDEADATLALMGCYSALQDQFLFDSDPWTGGVVRMDYMSDDGYPAWQWMAGGAIARGEHNSTSWMIGSMWSSAYRAISRTNRVIARVPEIENIDETAARRIVAEAKVIRAMVYNLLAMTYQDVPLIVQPQEVKEAKVSKNTKAEIVEFITEDLEAIIADLPDAEAVRGDQYGRLSSGAAIALLARIYLYHGQYAKAAQKAKDVMDLEEYSLSPDFQALFSVDNERDPEVIFSVAFDRFLDEGAAFAGYWGEGFIDYQRPLPALAESFYCTDGLPASESPLYDPANPSADRDPRFRASLVSNNDTWRGQMVEDMQDFYFQRKYAEENNSEDHFNTSQDFYVLRYADVLLMRAEALVRQGSYTESEVVGLINDVRNRVNMPKVEDVEGTGLSGADLLDIIKHERRVELAFEGLRYFDLVRWDELDDKYEQYNASEHQRLVDLGYPDVRLRNFVSYKWPLPQGELDINENLKQHDEWR